MPVCSTEELPRQSVSDGRRFDGNDEANAWGDDQYGDWRNGLSDNELESIRQYTHSSDNINRYLRGNSSTQTKILQDENNLASLYRSSGINQPLVQPNIANIDSALMRSVVPEDVVTYRAAKTSIWDKQPGFTMRDKGYTSTAMVSDETRVFLEHFKNSTIVEIRVPAGVHAAYISPNGPGKWFGKSTELLFARDTRFRVLVNEIVNGKKRIVVEVIP